MTATTKLTTTTTTNNNQKKLTFQTAQKYHMDSLIRTSVNTEEISQTLASIFTEVKESRTEAKEHFQRVDSAMDIIKDRLTAHDGQLTAHDERLSGHDERLSGHDDLLSKLDKQLEEQQEQLNTVFDFDVARRREYMQLKFQREADIEKNKKLEERIERLEQQLVTTQQQGQITQRTQHDDYAKAFSRSADFEKVFLFLLNFGYNTSTGMTCVVFKVIQDTLCVCVNFRALHLIAKLKLNMAQVTKTGKFPSFSLFRLNMLQSMFREAKLPEKELDKQQINVLFERLAMKPMKTPAANKASWIALEAEPFVVAANNLTMSDKIQDFMVLFQRFYPQKVTRKKLTEKDNCYFWGSEDMPESDRKPVFQVPYWKELFYKNMKEYKQLLRPDEDAGSDYCHFVSLYELQEPGPIYSYHDAFDEVSEEEDPEPVLSKKRQKTSPHRQSGQHHQGPAESEEDDFESEEERRGIPEKRPRRIL